MSETLEDMALNVDRHIEIGGDNDWEVTTGFDTVFQSVAIGVGGEIRDLVGSSLQGPQFERLRSRIEAAIRNDPQTDDDVQRVDIAAIDKSGSSVAVEVEVFTSFDESFEQTLTV